MTAFDAVVLLVVLIAEIRWFASRFSPANPVLDGLPPAAGHGEYGTAKVITERSKVEDAFGVCADDENPKDAGMYVGFYGPGPYARLASAFGRCIPRPGGEKPTERFRGEYILIPGDYHTIIFGDTRAGKTRRLLLATIMQIMKNPSESAVIFDPKGELYGYLKKALEALGVEVVRIDFKNPRWSSRWNMLDLAIEAWEQADYSKATQLVSDVVAELAPSSDKEGTSKYFNDGARSYIKSAALKIISDPTCPRDQKTVATVSRIIEAFGAATELDPGKPNSKTFVPYAEMLEMLPEMDHPATEAYSGARAANDKELKAFCSTVQTFLALFRDPALASMTSVTDNPFRNIATKRQAVFLIVPEKQAYAPFAKMYLNQAYTALVDIADEGGAVGGRTASGRLPQRVNFICEELCSIPKWDNLVNATNIGAGRGIRFFLIVQNKALFEAKYEKDAMGILGNCNNRVLIKTGDAENTARWLATEIGPYTIELKSETLSGGRFSPILMRRSVSKQLAGRDGMKVDEILRWKADYGSIVRVDGNTYVVPLPDVSMTPIQEECGLGDMRHNLEKIYDAMYGTPPRTDGESPKWSPELTKMIQGKTYTDKERRKARADYLAKLAASYKKRMYRQAAAGSGEGGKASMGALLNPATGEVRTFDSLDEGFIKALQSPKHKGWEWKVAESRSEIEAWSKERKSAIAGRAGKVAKGQLPLIDSGSFELRGGGADA